MTANLSFMHIPLPWVEPICSVILGTWYLLRLRREPQPRAFLGTVALLAMLACIAEDSCIRLYGFYDYNPAVWRMFIDQVPLLVVLIWPVVILSTCDLLFAGEPHPRWWWLSVFVLVDASLMEPIATQAQLWTWHEPGVFAVPIIGILGWGFFALGVAYGLHRRQQGHHWAWLLLAPAMCHALLLASWWGVFRWVRGEVPVLLIVAMSMVVSLYAWWRTRHVGGRRQTVLMRAPAAVFFLLLLPQAAAHAPMLWAYALPFSLPWLWQLRPGSK
jgi:hypothetical protein